MTGRDLGARRLCRGILTHPLGLHCNVPTDQVRPDGPGSVNRFLEGLRLAVERGATFIDTSDAYGLGHSERLIGRFLRAYPDLSPHLSSKVGHVRGSAEHPYAGRHIHHQLEQSLENLYAEQLDLYTLDSLDFGPDDRYLGNAIDVMRTLRDVESIKAIGMRGPFTRYGASPDEQREQAERFLFLFRLIKPDVVWIPFNAFTPTISLDGEDLFAFTARHGVGLVLAAPLAHGMLTGNSATQTASRAPFSSKRAGLAGPVGEWLDQSLQVLSNTFGHAPGTLTRLALRSALQRGDQCVVVVGFTDEDQVEENFSCLGPPLTPMELRIVDDVYAGLRTHLHQTALGPPVKELQV
ncbi:aldo/keto reductase (plasmid) [Streptomyces xanthophaeus]|uniref:aldo/keto reductase n=1 Tax=Streptomyces xanthophaeus TaxID=67385 RepID=UPI002F911E42|nr:aldo/keto reductase [Streptomyces xanthophaeus]